MFSIAQLLVPISATQTYGEDLSFSSELDAIARARTYDDPTLDQGEWVVALKEADWGFVASRCAKLIESRSKDLRLAVWLTEAMARTRGFRGLGDGYAVLAGLCEHYWDGLYPQDEAGEHEQRVGNLSWLLSRTSTLVREVALTEGCGYSLADFEAARLHAANNSNNDGAASPWGSQAGEADISLDDMEAERRRNSPAFNDALLGDAGYCLSMLGEFERVMDLRLGADGPGFSAAREALQNAIRFIAPAGGAAVAEGAHGVHAAATPGTLSAHGGGIDGPVRTREQALGQLRRVAEFFRRTEPHSPVAYLADKAASWGDMPLHVWLRAVIKDPGAIAGVEELLGAKGPGD